MKRNAWLSLWIALLCLLVPSSAQSRKSMLDYWKALKLGALYLPEQVDLTNDFIAFGQIGADLSGDFAVWSKRAGGDLIGLTMRGCSPVCTLAALEFKAVQRGSFVDVTATALPGVIRAKDGSVRFSATLEQQFLMTYNAKSGEPAINATNSLYAVFLPRQGTTVRICHCTGTCQIELGRYTWNGSGFVFQAVE